jgi:hypothetical protein
MVRTVRMAFRRFLALTENGFLALVAALFVILCLARRWTP